MLTPLQLCVMVPIGDYAMLTYYILAPLLIAVFLFIAASSNMARILAIISQSLLLAASVYLVIITREPEIFDFIGNYVGWGGISLRADSTSADFVMLTAFIFLAVSIYTYSTNQDKRLYWFLMFVLEAALIGFFLSGDLFNIFVLVEVSTLAVVLLTMFDRKKRNMYHGMVFLMANVVAVQFYLVGLLFIYRQAGVMDILRVTEILAGSDPADLVLPYALIMTSIAFKCALIPFFSWSPKVRLYPGAPTGVAAILSGLQIKSALYLFLQFQAIFRPIAAEDFFLIVGIVAGLFGAFMAICQSDIRMILAYHTISQIGLIIVGVSLGNPYSHIGGLYHIFGHAIFKTALFLSTGIIIPAYGTADIYKIRGVFKRMPIAGAATAFAVLGITGAPFFIGSVSKYFITYNVSPLITVVTALISLGTIISFVKFSSIFFGDSNLVGSAPKADKCRTIPVAVLGIFCLAGGIFGTRAIYVLFLHEVTVVLSSYAQKSLIFLVSAGAGYLIYNYTVKKSRALKRIGGMNLGFKTVCVGFGVFFAAILAWIWALSGLYVV